MWQRTLRIFSGATVKLPTALCRKQKILLSCGLNLDFGDIKEVILSHYCRRLYDNTSFEDEKPRLLLDLSVLSTILLCKGVMLMD